MPFPGLWLKSLEHFKVPESKVLINDENTSKGFRNQLKGVPTQQTWDNLFNHETKIGKGKH